jgi:phosphoglucomutase
MADNAQLIAQCEARAKEWLSPAFDEETRKEVQAMLDAEDKTPLIDAFYQNL